MKCWAAPLGGCGLGPSAEHLPSKTLFTKHGAVAVRGFPWCINSYKTVGLNSCVAQILCRRHNTELSAVDQEVGRFSDCLDGLYETHLTRIKNRRRGWTTKRWVTDGWLLERWFTKTSVDFLCVLGSESPWSLDDPAMAPPLDLVELAFGRKRFDSPRGLHSAASVGEFIRQPGMPFEPHLGFHVNQSPRGVAATWFELRGFRFLLWLGPETADEIETGLRALGKELNTQFIHKLQKVSFLDSSQTLEFEW